MAEGPRLPRKDTSLKRTRETLEGAAHQIGVLLAVERNRWRLTQEELADELGVGQIAISHMENGRPAAIPDPAFDALFKAFRAHKRRGARGLPEVVARPRDRELARARLDGLAVTTRSGHRR